MNYSDIIGDDQDNFFIENNQDSDFEHLFIGTTIRLDETPNGPWKLIPLTNDDDVWQIGISLSEAFPDRNDAVRPHDKNTNNLKIVTKVNNVITTEFLTTNEHLKTARKLYLEKYKEGFIPYGSELPTHLNGAMLAKVYKPPCAQNGQDKLNSRETRINKFPVSVMPKIDGIRALAKLEGKQVIMRSRLNNLFPHMSHIKAEIAEFLRYLPPHCELDGDLFNKNFTFGLVTSIVKTTKELHTRHDEIQYWIFDVLDPQNMFWEDRYKMLVNAYIKYLEDNGSSKHFTILQAYNATSHADIQNYHDRFIKEGYEGVMIRRYGCVDGEMARYKTGRNNNLVKYKLYEDTEVTVLNIINNRYLVKDDDGREFLVDLLFEPLTSGPERCGTLLSDAEYQNKRLTIKYSQDKVIPIAFRDYE